MDDGTGGSDGARGSHGPDAAAPGVSLRLPGVAWVLLAYAAFWCALAPLHRHPTISVETDFPRYAELADFPAVGAPWDPFVPVGYPRLLAWTEALVGDTFRAGEILSLLGGAWVLAAAHALARRFAGPRAAAYTTLLLAVNWLFVQNALFVGTDALWTGAVLTSFLLVLRGRDTGSRDAFGVAGVVLGLSWCVRYATMGLAPWFVVAAAAGPRGTPWRERFARAGLLAFGTLLGASPQLWAAARDAGNPFASGQAANVWFGAFRGRDWPARWGTWPDEISLASVVAEHPGPVLRNWAGNVAHAVVLAVTSPFGITAEGIARKPEPAIVAGGLVVTALVAAGRDGFARARAAVSVAAASGAFRIAAALAASYAAAISTAFWFPRFFLPVLVLTTLAGAGLARRALWPALDRRRTLRTALVVAAPILLAAHSVQAWTQWLRTNQQPVEEVGTALVAAGIRPGDVVAATTAQHYDDLLPFRFDAVPLGVQDLEDLQLALAQMDAAFLLLEERGGPGGPYHPGLYALFDTPGLTPFLEPVWMRRERPRVALFRAK